EISGSGSLVKHGCAVEAVALHHSFRVVQGFELNLPDSLAGDADLAADFLQSKALAAMQSEALFNDSPLLLVQFQEPRVEDCRYPFLLDALRRLSFGFVGKHVERRGVVVAGSGADTDALVKSDKP